MLVQLTLASLSLLQDSLLIEQITTVFGIKYNMACDGHAKVIGLSVSVSYDISLPSRWGIPEL